MRDLGWEERWVYPTKPWLPIEESENKVVHVEAWLKYRDGGATLTAACKPSLLLESKPVEDARPCLRCAQILRVHGLIA